jgi:steroid delta-isomerase-like uncharacterized protein
MTRKSAETLIKRYYEAFNRGDIDGMVDCLSPSFVHDVNEGDRRKGKVKFKAFCEHMKECYKEELKDLVIMANAEGTRGAAEFMVHGKYLATDGGLPKASGQRYKLPGGGFFSIGEDGITRVTTYYNLKDWIAQVSGKG